MFFSIQIINFILIYNLIWLVSIIGHANGDKIKANTTDQKPNNINNNVALVFNTGVLFPFSVYDVVFPVQEVEPGVLLDNYKFKYKPYVNVTNVLKELKQKGFRLIAIMNVFFTNELERILFKSDERRPITLNNLPKEHQVNEIFQIFHWKELFDKIIYFQNKLDDFMINVKNEIGIPLENMLYFDNNKKYDDIMRRVYGMSRCIAPKGMSYCKVKAALVKFAKKITSGKIKF